MPSGTEAPNHLGGGSSGRPAPTVGARVPALSLFPLLAVKVGEAGVGGNSAAERQFVFVSGALGVAAIADVIAAADDGTDPVDVECATAKWEESGLIGGPSIPLPPIPENAPSCDVC